MRSSRSLVLGGAALLAGCASSDAGRGTHRGPASERPSTPVEIFRALTTTAYTTDFDGKSVAGDICRFKLAAHAATFNYTRDFDGGQLFFLQLMWSRDPKQKLDFDIAVRDSGEHRVQWVTDFVVTAAELSRDPAADHYRATSYVQSAD